MIAFILVVGDPHRNKTTHSLASLTTSPSSEEAYFMVGKYTPLNPYYRYFPTTSGNGFNLSKLHLHFQLSKIQYRTNWNSERKETLDSKALNNLINQLSHRSLNFFMHIYIFIIYFLYYYIIIIIILLFIYIIYYIYIIYILFYILLFYLLFYILFYIYILLYILLFYIL